MAQYNAKTLPLGDPYIAASNYGVDFSNAHKKLDKLWDHRTEKDGGSKQIFDKLVQWASPEKIKARGGDPKDAQWQYWQDYFKTGKVNPNMRADTALRGLGVGLSETARAQQHKKISLFEKIAGPLLTIAASSIPVIGPYAGAAVGAYVGQRHGGGVLGGTLGAIGGYTGGVNIAKAGGISGIYNSAKNGISNFLSPGGFSNPSALGLTGANLGLNFGSAPGAFTAAPVAGYGAGALGVPGALGVTGANLGVNFASGAMTPRPGTNMNSVSHVSNEIGRSADAASLYTPRSEGAAGFGPTSSTIDKTLQGARTVGKTAQAINTIMNPPQATGPMPSPMAGSGGLGGAPAAMVPHGAIMRPLIEMPYPTNPFMARIV